MTTKQITAAAKKHAAVLSPAAKYANFANESKSVQYGMIFNQTFKSNDLQVLEEIYPDDFQYIAGKIRFILLRATDKGL